MSASVIVRLGIERRVDATIPRIKYLMPFPILQAPGNSARPGSLSGSESGTIAVPGFFLVPLQELDPGAP